MLVAVDLGQVVSKAMWESFGCNLGSTNGGYEDDYLMTLYNFI